jgi:mitotic spindle assembly checkpoint protein MAD2
VASNIWQTLGYGMLVTNDESLKAYLVDVLQQINDWLMAKMLQKLVLVITVGRCWLTQ